MSSIPAGLRRQLVFRAGDRCEYCGLAEQGQEATFHIDHIVPRAAGGPTAADNLALACVSCSLRKESRRSGQDPQTGRLVPFFNPRRQRWAGHFRRDVFTVVGLTPTGRTTVASLSLNRPLILAIRAEEAARGRQPPRR
jgi:hypothetical protein